MRAWPERKRRKARIEIIPMIDVMMFLLVFFVLISVNVLPALGLHITPPSSAVPEKIEEHRKVILGLAQDGATTLDGEAVAMEDIPARLRAMQNDTKLTVLIAGDGAADLQHVVEILDALKQAGIGSSAIIAKGH